MKKHEAEDLKAEIWHAVNKNGVPINVRTGINADGADWVMGLLEKHIKIDEPLGIIAGADYDYCPNCNGVIGQRAFFCKLCGAYVRSLPDDKK